MHFPFIFFLFTSWWLDRFSSADLEVLHSIFNLLIGNFQPNKTYTNFPYQCIKLIKFCIFPLSLWSPSPPSPNPFIPTLSFVLNRISSFFGHTVWLVGSQFPGQGLNHWTTREFPLVLSWNYQLHESCRLTLSSSCLHEGMGQLFQESRHLCSLTLTDNSCP